MFFVSFVCEQWFLEILKIDVFDLRFDSYFTMCVCNCRQLLKSRLASRSTRNYRIEKPFGVSFVSFRIVNYGSKLCLGLGIVISTRVLRVGTGFDELHSWSDGSLA